MKTILQFKNLFFILFFALSINAKVTTAACTNPTSSGIIAGSQTICAGSVPAAFTSTALPGGNDGTLEYKWQQSTSGSSGGFTDIASSNSETYAPGALSATTWYKRLSKVTCDATWPSTGESNVLEITVRPIPADQTVSPASQSICSGASATISIGSSQTNTNYTLRDNSNNTVIDGPKAGTGSSVNFNTGVLSTGKTYNILAEKVYANSTALSMDGSNEYVTTANVSIGSTWTYETLVKPNDISSIDWSGIITSNSGSGTGMWFQFSLNGSGKLRWESNDPGLSVDNIGPVVNDNTWHHVAVTCDGTNIRFYTDGVLVNTTPFTGGTMNRPLHIMAERVPTQFIRGLVDQTMVWNYARSLSEIQSDKTTLLAGTVPGLLVYYTYENGTGTTVTDLAGGDHNGTMMNMENEDWIADANPFSTNSTCPVVLSSTATVSIITAVNPTSAGTIASDQAGCNPFTADEITSLTLPTGHTGTLEYKWQRSTTSNSSGFNDIASSNATTYSPGALTATTWYKRLSKVTCDATWPAAGESNVVQITVNQGPTIAAAGSDQTVCASSTTLAGNTATEGTGTWTKTSGTATISDPSSPTSGLTGISGTAILKWTIATANCGSSFDEVSITSSLPANQTVTATSPVCTGNSSTITLGSSQSGVYYTLRDNSNNAVIAGPTAGIGSSVSFNTGALTSDKAYNVLATSGSKEALAFTGNAGLKKVSLGTTLWTNNFQGTNKATVEAWVNRTATGSLHTIVSNYEGSYPFLFRIDGDKITLFINSSPWVSGTTTLAINTWYHVAGTYDGTNLKVYVNGVLEGTYAYSGNFSSTANELKIGGGLSNNTEYFPGSISDVRLWNVARTAAEISASYNLELNGNEPGLIALYKMDEGAGSTLGNSATGNLYPGTLVNSPAWVAGPINASACPLQMTTTPTVTVNQPSFTPGTFTVANLQATGTAIKWYATETGGTALASTDAISNGTTYYASQTVYGVESIDRLAVTATIDPTPCAPTGSASQNRTSGQTLADLTVLGSNIRWYSAFTGGALLPSSTLLINNVTYYASQTVSCTESAIRFGVTAIIN